MFIHLYDGPKVGIDDEHNRYIYYQDFNDRCANFYQDAILVKENMHSDDFLRIYLKYYNQEKKFCSHVLKVKDESHDFILTDAAMNISPSLQEYVKIIDNAIKFYKATDSWYKENIMRDPTIHVNFLTHSGTFDIRNPISCTAELVATHYRNNLSDVTVTNWQLDSCLYLTPNKMQYSKYSCPNIIIVPNIDTGNAIYKALMISYDTMGFVVGGRLPAILNSRSRLSKNTESMAFLSENYQK